MFQFNKKKSVIYLAAGVLFLLLHFSGVLRPAETYFSRFYSPILHYFFALGSDVRQVYQRQTDRIDLTAENDKLTAEINSLLVENSKLKLLENENLKLRNFLDFLDNSKLKYVMANAISRQSLETAGQSISLDKGSDDGLAEGMAVINNQGVLAGKVSAAKEASAEVCLVNDPKCKIAAMILNGNQTAGIIRGELGLTVKMELIPQTEKLAVGDVVVTSGLEGNMAKGLVIGRVLQVIQENNDIWQSALIEPAADLDDLAIVSVAYKN